MVNQKQTCILILGMHRSGTSALSSALNALGLPLGSSLMEPGEDNPKGYFENKKIYQFNDDRLLGTLHARWDSQAILKSGWENATGVKELYSDAAQLILEEYSEFPLFGIKDPRMCLLLPFWNRVFESLNIEIKVVFIFRNPLEIADSLLYRNGFEEKKSLGLSIKYFLMGEFNSRPFSRVFVSFDQLLRAPKDTLNYIFDRLGVSLENEFIASSEIIRDLLDTKLKHSTRQITFTQETPEIIKKTTFILSELATNLESEASLLDELDMLREELEGYSDYFSEEYKLAEAQYKVAEKYSQELADNNKRIVELKNLVKKRDVQIEKQNSQLASLENKLKGEVKKHSQEIADYKQRIIDFKELVTKHDSQISQQNNRLALLEDRLQNKEEKYNKETMNYKRRIASLKDLIGKRDNQLIKQKDKLTLQNVKLNQYQSQISDIQQSKAWYVFSLYSKMKQKIRGKRSSVRVPISKPRVEFKSGISDQGMTSPEPLNETNTLIEGQLRKSQYLLVTCWLTKFEQLHEIINATIYSLSARDIDSIVLTSSKELHNVEDLSTCLIHFLLSRHNPRIDLPVVSIPEWMQEIIQLEKKWIQVSGIHINNVEDKCRKTFYFWHYMFLNNTPAFCLIWGSTAPLSRVLIKLSQLFNVPFLIIERGHFPGTIFVDTYGQLGFSNINRQPQTATLKEFPLDYERLREITEWENRDTNMAYQSSNLKTGIKELLKHRFRDSSFKSLILFIGANDLGSGCAYSITDTAETHCALFGSSYDAFTYLYKVVSSRFPETLLLLKAHPNEDSSIYQELGDNVVVASEYNINELISLADVAVSLSTTAFAKCILEETPILTLARTDLAFKNIAYECYQKTDIVVMLDAALEREDFVTKSKNGFRYIQYLFDQKLLALDEKIPTRMRSADFSEFIFNYVTNFRHEVTNPQGQVEKILNETFKNKLKKKKWLGVRSLPNVDIIIQVYCDVEATVSCIDSVLKERKRKDYQVVIVNDHSPVPEMQEVLERYAHQEGVIVLTNEFNIGFPASVNKGMRQFLSNDVIILNSDTLVTPGWVEKLQDHAHKNAGTATVTPMSNNASIFSFPSFPRGSELSDADTVFNINAAMSQVNQGKSLEVPVGHGFCMFIRRDCIDKIGYLDEVTFGRGYSEEIDFCLRARSAGLVNRVALDVFIGHVGGLSFNDDQNKEKMKKREIIKNRYPNYFSEIKKFVDSDPLKPYRDATVDKMSGG